MEIRLKYFSHIDKWWKGSTRIVRKILSNKIDSLGINFFPHYKTIGGFSFLYGLKRVIERLKPWSRRKNHSKRWYLSGEKNEYSINLLYLRKICSLSLSCLPIAYQKKKNSTSPSLPKEKISSTVFFKILYFFNFSQSIYLSSLLTWNCNSLKISEQLTESWKNVHFFIHLYYKIKCTF